MTLTKLTPYEIQEHGQLKFLKVIPFLTKVTYFKYRTNFATIV